MWLLQIVFLCISCVRFSFAYGTGAPSLSCDSMLPGHINKSNANPDLHFPISAQEKDSSPYIIKAEWDDRLVKYVRLSITGSTVQGFLIQARETEDGPAVGNFKMLPSESKYQSCVAEKPKFDPEASITHTNPSTKANISFLWAPSFGQKGNVTFYATIARTKDVFWVKLPSNEVTILKTTNTASPVMVHSVFSTLVPLIFTVLTAINYD